jgi:hypothetical protein
MKNEEMEACKGLLRGLVKYEKEGNNEFQDWIPDSIMEIAAGIVDEYGEHNVDTDAASIRLELGDN